MPAIGHEEERRIATRPQKPAERHARAAGGQGGARAAKAESPGEDRGGVRGFGADIPAFMLLPTRKSSPGAAPIPPEEEESEA